jgi:hypothetical protein
MGGDVRRNGGRDVPRFRHPFPRRGREQTWVILWVSWRRQVTVTYHLFLVCGGHSLRRCPLVDAKYVDAH